MLQEIQDVVYRSLTLTIPNHQPVVRFFAHRQVFRCVVTEVSLLPVNAYATCRPIPQIVSTSTARKEHGHIWVGTFNEKPLNRFVGAAGITDKVPVMDLPPGVPEQFDEHIRLQFDLARLAFKSDITRVVTLLGARDLTGRSYPFPKGDLFPNGGTSVSFHGGSHHQDDPTQIKRYADLNRYHVSTLAYFVQKLKEEQDGDGTLLDHSLVMYGTNMGNSNQHQHYDVPHILVGGAGGRLKGGRHLAYERKTVTTGNLLLSVMDLYGIHNDEQGDSTGRLEKLV